MDKTFSAVNSICNGSEPHEHEMKLYENIADNVVCDKFIKDGLNFYVMFTGTPYITYTHNDSAEHLAEVERIKNYIDSLTVPYIDYDEIESGLRIYYYTQDITTNQWIDYDNSWQSDILSCTVMQGQQSVLMSQYTTLESGSYRLRYAIVNGSIELLSDTTKLVFLNGSDITLNGTVYDEQTTHLIEGNVSITTSGTAYITIIEDAV